MLSAIITTVLLSASLNVIPAPNETRLNGKEAPVTAMERCRVRFSKKLKPEEYILKVRRKSVKIKAGGPAGEFYARQTLAQERDNQGVLLRGTIKDSPRFEWRGYMLDESRHFFGEEFVLKTLDLMAYYKLNKFHWHLTDAPGWRIEIKKYPELTTVGATGCYTDPQAPPRFYTQDQVRRIVAYAAERHIEVIPEFDMPGHASAACRAYPWLMGGMDPDDPDAQFTFNVGSEKVYEFISDVLDEIFSLFPSEYIHIGGDEVNFGSACWNDNPDIQALMKREGIEDLKQVEGWFLKKMAGVIAEKGHRLIAWDDVMDGGADVKEAAIMWWRHERPDHITQALDNGQKAILTPRRPLYLDFVQFPGHTQGRSSYRGEYVCCTLKDIHDFPEVNVAEVEFTPERLSNVLGIQGNLWTETVSTEERADHMSWPRLCAIAESGWTIPENKDFASFETRMDSAFKHLESRGVHFFDYRDPERYPEVPSAVRK